METNETIYEQLKQQAAEIFNNYIICAPGSYTANDIAKEIIYDTETIYETKTSPVTGCSQQQRRTIVKNRRFKSGKFEFKEGYKPEDDTREIVYGSFSCSVDGLSIFSVLKKTAAAWKVPTSKKAIFVRETETAATVAAFDSPDTATARQLKNSVANDPLRPVMGYVFADTRRRCLVSCDGYLMTVTAAPTMTTTTSANGDDNSAAGFLISPALLKNKTTIKITAENMATNGTAAADLGAGNFPNWYNVANKEYNDAQAVNLGNVWTKMKKTAANFAKFTDLDRTPVLITGEKGNNNIILYTENYNGDSRRESFDLPSVLNYSFAVLLNGSQLAKIEKANTMYLINAYTPAVFTSGNVFTMAQIVNRDGHFENFSNAFTFEAPTTGAPANLLHFAEEPATVAAAVADTPTTATTTETAEPTPEPASVATDDATGESSEPASVATDDTSDDTTATATTPEPATVASDDTTGATSGPATAPAAVASLENKIIICSIPRPANVANDDTSDDDATTATDDTTGESSEPATAPAAVIWLRPLLQYAAAAFIGIFAALLLVLTPERAQQATAITIEPATVAAAVADTLTTDTTTATTSEPANVAAAVADTLTTDTATATTPEPANVANDDTTATTSEPATAPAAVADTLTTDTATATTSEPATVADDDTTGESSEPATVATDDASDDDATTATDDTSDDSDDDGATSGSTTANGATTTTTTTPGQPTPATTSGPATVAAAAGL